MSMNGRPPRIHVVSDRAPAGADWEEDTQPEPPEAVTVRAVLQAVKRLEITVGTLSHAVGGLQRVVVWSAVSAGALVLTGLVLWWAR